MLGYRRKSFRAAHAFLEELRADPRKLSTLSSLQYLLIAEITTAEQKIRALKKALASSIRAESANAPSERPTHLENRIEGLRQLNFVWRCFGDAIAFIYMDKHALKHTYYNTTNTNPKQGAGFLLGKEGLKSELAVMEEALADGIPCLLVDLTNTIRHGDIVFMVGPDPRLVEVKIGPKVDRRGRKQVQNINQLHDFFETDHAEALRGMTVQRVEFREPERSYIHEMNACIEAAVEHGYSIISPERGLHYVALAGGAPPIGTVFELVGAKRPWVFSLNAHKSARDWAPYLPFVLSLRSRVRLYQFLQGTLYLLVVVDTDAVCVFAANRGFAAEFDFANVDLPLKMTKTDLGPDAQISVSSHMLRRIGLEFVSPQWMIDAAFESFERNRFRLHGETALH
jgi:hypothetical protein